MKVSLRHLSFLMLWMCMGMMPAACAAQDALAGPLEVRVSILPRAFARQAYRYQLDAQGGVPPLTWTLATGTMPEGLGLSGNGVLSGVPTSAGEFHFTITVADNGRPAHQRNQEIVVRVFAPLMVQWSKPPKINGHRIEGAIKVSNQTDQDFDLTTVMVAVNETGRATAIGYQHFTLKQDTMEFEIPFGENLPQGAYSLNVDVVGEVAATNSIYRVRLAPEKKIEVKQGP